MTAVAAIVQTIVAGAHRTATGALAADLDLAVGSKSGGSS